MPKPGTMFNERRRKGRACREGRQSTVSSLAAVIGQHNFVDSVHCVLPHSRECTYLSSRSREKGGDRAAVVCCGRPKGAPAVALVAVLSRSPFARARVVVFFFFPARNFYEFFSSNLQ